MCHDVESLSAEIADAFAAREHPGDDNVAHIQEGCTDYEGNEAREWLRGMTWKDLLSQGMGLDHRDYVCFLTPEGWLYFFPALATFALDIDHPAEMDNTLLNKLAWFPQEVMDLLTPSERRAIVHFLEYLSDAHEARDYENNLAEYALWAHWGPNPVLQKSGDDPGNETDAT